MTIAPARHPSGTHVGGRFAPCARPESGVLLASPAPAPDPVEPETPINGLVARQNSLGRWMLVSADTGLPVMREAQTRARSSHETREQALSWAQESYPLVARTAARLARRHPAAAPACSSCVVEMVQEVDDETARRSLVWVCPVCQATSR